MMKKILLVGDLRTAYNYGAIATTESLLDLIDVKIPNAEVKLIDHRSFRGTTPENGWPAANYEEALKKDGKKKVLKEFLIKFSKKIGVYHFLKRVYGIFKSSATTDNVPTRYDYYELFAKKILNDETWKYEKRLIEWADIVLVNSEGNIVNGTGVDGKYRVGGRYVLFMEYLSKIIMKKPCYVINHTVDPKNRDIKKIIENVYPHLDGVYVREKKSYQILQSWGITNMQYVPDALWSHDFSKDPKVQKPKCLKDFDFDKPYICIGDSSGIQNAYSHVKWDIVEQYTVMINELKKICPNIIFIDGYKGYNKNINDVILKNNIATVNLRTCNYHELYYVLERAEIFISGRWHASIISLLAHTPILLWGSDSHKTEALYDEIDYPYEFFDVAALPLNIDRIVNEAKKIMQDKHDIQWELVEKLKKESLRNVDMLENE